MTTRLLRGALMACAAALIAGAAVPVNAQGQGGAIVIQGGTLIDGMGGAPVANSVVVIQGNRITAVGRAGQVQVPAGAQVINAAGKWVLPGLWDNQNNFAWFWGELDLNNGITTAVDIGDGEEESVAVKDAVNMGHLIAPRQLVAVAHIGGLGNRALTGLETPLTTRQMPKTADEAKATADRLLAAGADMIQFHDGHFPAELYKAAYDEAHKAGKPGFCRCGGPVMGPKEGAEAGADWFPHSTGIGAAIAKTGAPRAQAGGDLGNYANMDDAKANELIKILVAHHVALVPTIVHDSPGYPKDWARMEAEARKTMSNPDLLAYYDEDFLKNAMNVYDRAKQPGATTPDGMKGYQNMLRFNKMYDAAGGHVLPGGDTNQGKVPGNILHDEMESFQEAGIPQMHIIEGATEWAAEAMRVQNNVGSVTNGKLADVIVVDADPLQDVANLRKVSTVVLNGKMVPLGYHASYYSPFPGSADDRFVVERLPWVVAVKKETVGGGGGRGGGGVPDPLESPQPAVETLTPYSVVQGSPGATLTVKGFNFVRKTRVYVDGVSMPFMRVSPTELAVTLDANFLARAGRYDVMVKNPEPIADPSWGNGESNPAHFMVTYKN